MNKVPFVQPEEADPHKQRVLCAAIMLENGLVIPGARHLDAVMTNVLMELEVPLESNIQEGFIDQYGNFLTREIAYEIAVRRVQTIDSPYKHGVLTSEDLY